MQLNSDESPPKHFAIRVDVLGDVLVETAEQMPELNVVGCDNYSSDSVTDSSPGFELSGWLPLLECPGCGGPLQELQHTPGAGCPMCEREFPIEDGILRCLNLDVADPEAAIKQQEVSIRDSEANVYEQRFKQLRSQMEIPTSLKSLELKRQDVVAELGCGTGRFTLQMAPRVKRLVAVDFSVESLKRIQQRLSPEVSRRVLLVQADITALPLAQRAFSKVASFQVLEHLPSPASRERAIRSASKLLQPGGTFTASVYNWSLEKQRWAKQGLGDNTLKEGFHQTGIYYYNFESEELRQLFHEAEVRVTELRGLIVPFRGASLLGVGSVLISRWLSGTSYGIRRGHLLLIRGTRPVHA